MKLRPEFHPLVGADITDAAAWYEERETGLGDRFIAESRLRIVRLPREALLYAVRFADIRRVNLRTFPFGIFYFILDDTVIVLGVLHGARDTPRRNWRADAVPTVEAEFTTARILR